MADRAVLPPEAAPATRSSSRLAAGRSSKSSSKASSKSSRKTSADIDEITPITVPKRKKRSRTGAPTTHKKKVRHAARALAAAPKEHSKNSGAATSSYDQSLLCGGFSIDTILSDEDDVEEFNKYFRVKSQEELEAATTSIVKANTKKSRTTRGGAKDEKKFRTCVPLYYEQKNGKVALTLRPAEMDADLIEILGKTPEAFNAPARPSREKAVSKSAQTPYTQSGKRAEPNAPRRATHSPRRSSAAAPKKTPLAPAIKKPATRSKKAGKKGKSGNPEVDRYFKPHPEWKGYITCISCGKTQWPPNREKHLPKCPGLHPELAK